jgi:hypothetical protein
MGNKSDLSNSVNFYNPSPVRKQLFQLMRIKFPGGKAETHANFSLTIHPDRIEYYLNLFSQYRDKIKG